MAFYPCVWPENPFLKRDDAPGPVSSCPHPMEAKKAAGAPGVPVCLSDSGPGQVGRGRPRRKRKVLGPQVHQESSLGRSTSECCTLGEQPPRSWLLPVARNFGLK